MLSKEEIKAYVEANPNLVNCRESSRYPGLFTLKYKKKVFYDALWTPELEEMRGTVVDKDFNVVIRPFKKIYNYNENEATIPLDEDVIAVEKINGFMGAFTFIKDRGVVCSTTGSLDSEFVTLAESNLQPYLKDWMSKFGHGYTWLFEVVDKSDPHIITEGLGLYLIGCRNVETGEMVEESELDHYQERWAGNGFALGALVRRPVWSRTKFENVVRWSKVSTNEGYVVYGKTTTLKIKTPFYLTMKFLARCKDDKLDHVLENRQRMEEEFYPLLDHIQHNASYFKTMDEQRKLEYCKDYFYG